MLHFWIIKPNARRSLPGLIAIVPVFFASMPFVRMINAILVKIMPNDETEAVSTNTFIGRVATIGQATAKNGLPAQAKLHDQHGQAHYVLVEPDEASIELGPGTEVLLVRRSGAKFFAIVNPSAALSRAKTS